MTRHDPYRVSRISAAIKYESALTLLELLLTLAVVSILLLIAIPSTQHFIQRNHLVVDMQKIISALSFARTEAITRGEIVTFCPNNNNLQCGQDWSQGFLVFADKNANHQFEKADALLKVFAPLTKGVHLSWQGFDSKDYIQMQPVGFGNTSNGRFIYVPADHHLQNQRTIVVNRNGRAAIQTSLIS